MVQICQGTKTKNEMLAESVEQYKDMFIRAKGEFAKVISVGGIPLWYYKSRFEI